MMIMIMIMVVVKEPRKVGISLKLRVNFFSHFTSSSERK